MKNKRKKSRKGIKRNWRLTHYCLSQAKQEGAREGDCVYCSEDMDWGYEGEIES